MNYAASRNSASLVAQNVAPVSKFASETPRNSLESGFAAQLDYERSTRLRTFDRPTNVWKEFER